MDPVSIDDLVSVNEDAPQIVAIIDERPPSLRVDEKTKNPLWQPIGSSDAPSDAGDKQMITGFKIGPKLNDTGKFFRDISPPRKPKRELKKEPNKNQSPPNGSHSTKDPYEDRSPSRQNNRDISSLKRGKTDNGDMSSPRKRNYSENKGHSTSHLSEDYSPPRRKRELSLPRNRNRDMSPPRKPYTKEKEFSRSRTKQEFSPPRRKREEASIKMDKTLDGKTAGLQKTDELIKESKQIRLKEDAMFKQLSKDVSGESAPTVLRDRKTGKKRDVIEEYNRLKEKEAAEEKQKEKYTRWGRGLAQVESRELRIQEELHEMSKPLARYADDEDLERFLKEQEREGDPMLAYLRKKKRKEAASEGKVEKPQFEGEYMPNRFGVKPGHRWDGVDRSNGYEKRWFEVQNARTALEEDVYKWNTEDM